MSIYAEYRGRGKSRKLNGWFKIEVTVHGKRLKRRARTMAEAQVIEDQLRNLLFTPELFLENQRARELDQTVTLGQLSARARGHLWRGHKTEARVWRSYVDPALAILGADTPLVALTTKRMDRFREELTERGFGPGSINRFLAALCSLLKWARKRDMLLVVPDFPWQDEPTGRTRTLTAQEEAAVYNWFETRGYAKQADFLRVLTIAGMRRSENFKLQPGDIVGNYARLYDTKNGDVRSVALAPEAREILLRRLPWRFSLSRLSALWVEMRADLGLAFDKEFVIHSLRHTYGTRMVEAGIPPNVIQKAMGHRDIRSTLRYAHVREDIVMDAVLRVAEKRGASGGVALTMPLSVSHEKPQENPEEPWLIAA